MLAGSERRELCWVVRGFGARPENLASGSKLWRAIPLLLNFAESRRRPYSRQINLDNFSRNPNRSLRQLRWEVES